MEEKCRGVVTRGLTGALLLPARMGDDGFGDSDDDGNDEGEDEDDERIKFRDDDDDDDEVSLFVQFSSMSSIAHVVIMWRHCMYA